MQTSSSTKHSRIPKTLMAIGVSAMLTTGPFAWGAVSAALGKLATGGEATINGRVANPGSSIYSGNRIVTQRNSAVALSLAGGSEIILVEASALQLQRRDSQIGGTIEAGSAAVLSPAAFPVAIIADGVRVLPERGGSVYEVQLKGETLTVTVRQGFVNVEAANRMIEVSRGRKLEASLAAQQPEGVGAPALRSRITRFTIVAAGVMASAALAISIVDLNATCRVSPSSVGSCEIVH